MQPVRETTEWMNGRLCRCAEFRLLAADAPALLAWLEKQPGPVLALRRRSDGRVTVVLSPAKEETNG